MHGQNSADKIKSMDEKDINWIMSLKRKKILDNEDNWELCFAVASWSLFQSPLKSMEVSPWTTVSLYETQ